MEAVLVVSGRSPIPADAAASYRRQCPSARQPIAGDLNVPVGRPATGSASSGCRSRAAGWCG